MEHVTRRRFLRATSVGAAVVGVLSALPAHALADQREGGVSQGQAAPPTGTAPAAAPLPVGGSAALTGTLVVYINEPASGQGVIFVGEQAIPFDNPALVQTVQQAVG